MVPYADCNLLKFRDGGYVPIVIAVLVFALMVIWKRGRTVLLHRVLSTAARTIELEPLKRELEKMVLARFTDPSAG